MVCQFLLYNKVNQLYVYIYPHIPSLLRLPPTLPIPPLQEIRKHRADLPVLCGCFPLAIYFTSGSVYHPYFFKSFFRIPLSIPQEILSALPSISRMLLLATFSTSVTLIQAIFHAALAWIIQASSALVLPFLAPLQSVLDPAARAILQKCKSDCVSPLFTPPRWTPSHSSKAKVLQWLLWSVPQPFL